MEREQVCPGHSQEEPAVTAPPRPQMPRGLGIWSPRPACSVWQLLPNGRVENGVPSTVFRICWFWIFAACLNTGVTE